MINAQGVCLSRGARIRVNGEVVYKRYATQEPLPNLTKHKKHEETI